MLVSTSIEIVRAEVMEITAYLFNEDKFREFIGFSTASFITQPAKSTQ